MTKQLLCVSAGLLLFGVTSAHAQVTTASINGTITDQATKETLIGASVVARHLPTGTVYGAATNAKGNFMLQGLRPGGPYVIEVSYVGYQSIKLENISLSLGETETFNIKLSDDSKSLQDVVVTGKKGNSLNATRTGAATSFSRSAIDRTPTVDRNLFDIAKLSPQASISSNGAVSFAGSNNRYNSFQIDGAVSNDVFGLSSSGTNGGQAGSTPISIEAIDALQVVIAPYDVRQSGFTGGGINAITKSGTNDLKGSAYAFYKDQNFFGKTAGRENEGKRQSLSSQHEYIVGATLGGALIKNKLFYFFNAEVSDETYPTRYLPGAGSAISDADAKSVEDKIKALTGGNNAGGYGITEVPRRSYKGLARIDWNINSAHRLSLRYSYLDASKYNFSNSERVLRFLNNGYTFNSKTHSFVGELNSRFSNAVSNEFRFGYNRIRDNRELNGETMPNIRVRHGNNDIYLGSDPNSVANYLNQDIFTLTNNLTWANGNHTYTFGTHNEFFTLTNLFIPNSAGTYTYDSLEDFLSIGTANTKLPSSYRYSYSNVAGQPRWAPTFSAAQIGFYAQDEWKVNNQLRLTYGLRVDVPIFLDTPTANETYNASAIAKKYGANHTMPKSTPLFSPRIGFRYDLDETKKHLIRGGVGIFTGRIPFVWIGNSFGNTGVELSQINLSNANAVKGAPGFAFSADPNQQYPFNPEAKAAGVNAKTVPNTINLLTSNLKFPQTLRANLAYETTLPGDIKFVLEGVYNKSFNNVMYTNINRQATGKTFDHGSIQRPTYETVDKSFGDIIYLSNTDKGHSYMFSGQLSKDFDFGLSASVSYTYGKSRGVIDGTSSIAYSNWQYAYTYAGQDTEEMAYTTFDTRHRVVANLNYRVEYGKNFATTIGLIYNGQTGSRFSMVYYGDINGDGPTGNDLMYVPTKDEIAGMKFKDATSYDRETKQTTVTVAAADMPRLLEEFISGEEQIAQYRGSYIPRNGLVAPFVHKIDLHFAQDFYFNVGKRRHTIQLNADVMNFANLLNPNWGVTRSVSYSVSPLAYNRDGSYTFTPFRTGKMWTLSDIESRWRAQVGIKYIF